MGFSRKTAPNGTTLTSALAFKLVPEKLQCIPEVLPLQGAGPSSVISPGHSGTCSLRSVWHRALPLCTAGAFWEVVHGLSSVDRRCFLHGRSRAASHFPSGKSVFSPRGPANLGGGASESLTPSSSESKRNRGRLQFMFLSAEPPVQRSSCSLNLGTGRQV